MSYGTVIEWLFLHAATPVVILAVLGLYTLSKFVIRLPGKIKDYIIAGLLK